MFLELQHSDFTVKKVINREEAYAKLRVTQERLKSGEYSNLNNNLTLHNGAKDRGGKAIFNVLSVPDFVDGSNESLIKFAIKDSVILISKENSRKSRKTSGFRQFIAASIAANTQSAIFEELTPEEFDLSNSFLEGLFNDIISDIGGDPEDFTIKMVEDCYLEDLFASQQEVAEKSAFYLCPLTKKICYDITDLIAIRFTNKDSLITPDDHNRTRIAFGIEDAFREFTFLHKSAAEEFKFKSACIKRFEEGQNILA